MGAVAEGVGLSVGAASEAMSASILLVVAGLCEAVVLGVVALFVSEVDVLLLGSEVDVSLVLASVCVLATTTLLDVLETLDAELEGLGSVMLK